MPLPKMPENAQTRYVVAMILVGSALGAFAQTTQGLISGRITDSVTGAPVAANVTCNNRLTQTSFRTQTGPDGFYALPLLPPGDYDVEVSAKGYQAKARFANALAVASSLSLDFALRPIRDVHEPILPRTLIAPGERSILDFYGPDVDPNFWTTYSPHPGETGKLEPSISNAVRPAEIQQLPLEGNNIYSILLAEPGVAASNSTSRSLGIAANGMRPSSSSFLLDGVDTNFFLITGPLFPVSPESMQEYNFSTNNFSAEYGGAAGYIANAVTRAGGAEWHGQIYLNLQNEKLNANGFENNAQSFERRPDRELRPGFFAGGPLKRNRLFLGASTEYFRTRTREQPLNANLLNSAWMRFAGCPSASTIACGLLRDYVAPKPVPDDPYVAPVRIEPPVALNRWFSTGRLDYSSSGGFAHGTFRAAFLRLSEPDFIWSPYPGYTSRLNQPVTSLATHWTFTISPTAVNELTAGWSDGHISWERAQSSVPILQAFVPFGPGYKYAPVLPGSPAAYGLNDSSRAAEIHDEQVILHGDHILKFGGGIILRHLDDLVSYAQAGVYTFKDELDFAADAPSSFSVALSRLAAQPAQPNLNRVYRETQFFAFVQDTFRFSPRLVLNAGVRYDNFGGPVSTGAFRDPEVSLGSGGTVEQRAETAQLVPLLSSSSVYRGANGSIAPRAGFSWDILPQVHTMLRGGFGIFYDRIFDNLWLNARNNSFSFDLIGFSLPGGRTNYLAPISSVLPAYAGQRLTTTFPSLTAFQNPMPNGYAEDFFLGIQQQAGQSWSFEIDGAGSLGRKLVTTDVLNYNAPNDSPPINWISSQGISDYYSLSAVARRRARRSFLQAAWTWSHALDNQSDPLAGDFFNLLFINLGNAASPLANAGFSMPGNSRADRGSADFDQRLSLVAYGAWWLPGIGRPHLRAISNGWIVSALGAARSGFPYSIYTSSVDPSVLNARAHTSNAATALLSSSLPWSGGVKVFDSSAFCPTDACSLPETGRNVFAGPGLVNLDLSLARVVPLKWLGESGALQIRATFFNAFNHANLNPPGNIPGTPNYGIALYGTPPANSGFPALVPLAETARRGEFLLRVTF